GALEALQEGLAGVDLRLGAGAFSSEALDDVHTVVISPGLNPREEPVAALLDAAQARGIEVLGEIELFARALADLREQGYAPAVVAVTGTNGKTTVTALVRTLAE